MRLSKGKAKQQRKKDVNKEKQQTRQQQKKQKSKQKSKYQTKYITYKSNLKEKTKRQLIRKTESQIINNQRWNIQINKDEQQKWRKIFNLIQQSRCKYIYSSKINYSNIIIDIQNIRFSQLQTLFLVQNNINNIQALSFINMPQIKSINISKNKIANTKPLFKMYLKHVQSIQINSNLINSINQIHRVKMDHSNHSVYFKLHDGNPANQQLYYRNYQNDENNKPQKQIQIYNINQWAKFNNPKSDSILSSQFIHKFVILHLIKSFNTKKHYIPQDKVIKSLKNKFQY